MDDAFVLPIPELTNDELGAVKSKLPLMCASYHPATVEPIVICLGGRKPIAAPSLDVDEFNRERGISEFEVRAMECGMLFGWCAPGADPDLWEARAHRAVA